MQLAKGTFEVKLTPLAFEGEAAGSALGRMSIDKQIAGDLVGSSKGQMLSAFTGTQGSAGYVAIERVEGALAGRAGSFVLQHNATMNRGVPSLSVTVVPDWAPVRWRGWPATSRSSSPTASTATSSATRSRRRHAAARSRSRMRRPTGTIVNDMRSGATRPSGVSTASISKWTNSIASSIFISVSAR